MSKTVNVDFTTRIIEIETDGKEHFISAALAAKNANADAQTAKKAAEDALKIVDNLQITGESTAQAKKSAEAALTSEKNAKASEEAVTTKAKEVTNKHDDVVTKHSDVVMKAERVNTDAANAQKAADTADDIATQLTEYLKTKESLTAPVVDKTLLIEGAAADSKTVGVGLGKIQDNYLTFGEYVTLEGIRTNNSIYNSTKNQTEYLSGFHTISFVVNEGDNLLITGWNSSFNYNPTLFKDNTVVETIYATGIYQDFKVTIPSGVNKLIINGRNNIAESFAKKLVINSVSKKFKNDYKERGQRLTNLEELKHHIRVVNTNGDINVVMRNYTSSENLECLFRRKSGNNLPDFAGWIRSDASSGSVKANVLWSSSDFLSPSIVFAVNNIDGDFPAFSARHLTGGWHTYGGRMDTNASATARNIAYRVYCDDIEVSDGKTVDGQRVTINIINRLQGSNTEKEDGSGREIIEQHFEITFTDGFKCKIRGKITALEDVLYALYYGISSILIPQKPVYFLGCRAKRGEQIPATESNRCDDKNCYEVLQMGDNDIFRMGFNPTIDLGCLYANNWLHSAVMASGKAYMVLIADNKNHSQDSMLSLNKGDSIFWEGYFELAPNLISN